MDYLYSGDPNYRGPDPMTYRLHAWHFLTCAEYAIEGCKKMTGQEPSMMLNVPVIHLICHSVEMFLKLGLFKAGSSNRDLKEISVRHNLSELRNLCEKTGMTFSDDCNRLINSLSPIHADHRLRYTAFQEPAYWLPYNPREMIAITRNLIGLSSPAQSAWPLESP